MNAPRQRRSTVKNRYHNVLNVEDFEQRREHYLRLGKIVVYNCSPYHKESPGDFGCKPEPLPDKTHCDAIGFYSKDEATRLLRIGLCNGWVSTKNAANADWPLYVWGITNDGHPVEGKWGGNGEYHGYPLGESEPMYDYILSRWADK